MHLYLIVTERDYVESDFSESYGKHLFNRGNGSEKGDRIACACGYN
jgi:hypothetical protein